MAIKNLPADINAEVLLDFYPKGTFNVELKGMHKRNSYNDVLSIDESEGRIDLLLGRDSIYNSLPEALFHQIDRFDLPQYNYKEKFEEECSDLKREIENAYKFFSPIDLSLLHHRVKARHVIQELTSDNNVLIGIISDRLNKKQKNNVFIKHSLGYLPYCKIIRGDRTLITMMLRKVLMKEGLTVNINYESKDFCNNKPRYNTETGSDLEKLYLNSEFSQDVYCYNIHYWNEEKCDEKFKSFVENLEEYRIFIQDFFLSVESILAFNVSIDDDPLKLSDTTIYNYLNYNTNI